MQLVRAQERDGLEAESIKFRGVCICKGGCKPKPPKIPSPQRQLRSAISQAGGNKELTGRTDIEIEISNPCARLIANAILYYSSAILWRLLTKASGNAKALALIKTMSLSGVAPHPSERAPHLPRRRTSHRPGCDRDGVGVTEFSGVWAYNPKLDWRVGLGGLTAPRQGRGSMALRGIDLVTWSAHYPLLRYPFPKLRSKWFYTS